MQSSKRRVIDVREYPEFAAGHIEGAELVPLASLNESSRQWDRGQPLLLVCKSGRRAEQARGQLAAKGFRDLEVLQGGVEQWCSSGHSLQCVEGRKPWSLERQVRAGAGSMILASLALAYLFSPWFLLWTAFVGAGLTFAGVTDICLMATVLGKLPWNRPMRVGA